MTEEQKAASRPISTLVDKPATVRQSMSRPMASVPKRCCREGARLFVVKSDTCAASCTSKPAITTTTSTTAATTQVTSVFLRLPALRARSLGR